MVFVLGVAATLVFACGSEPEPTPNGTVQCNCGCMVTTVRAEDGCYRGACDPCNVRGPDAAVDASRDANDGSSDAGDGSNDANDAGDGG